MPSAALWSCGRGAPRGGPLRSALDRRGARAARLLPRAPWAAHAAPADGGARRERPAVSAFLRDRRDVSDVRWPGFSGMVSLPPPRGGKIVASTKLFALAESLGGVESLIEVPQAMTHQSVEGSSAAVPPDLVRCELRDRGRRSTWSRTCARRSPSSRRPACALKADSAPRRSKRSAFDSPQGRADRSRPGLRAARARSRCPRQSDVSAARPAPERAVADRAPADLPPLPRSTPPRWSSRSPAPRRPRPRRAAPGRVEAAPGRIEPPDSAAPARDIELSRPSDRRRRDPQCDGASERRSHCRPWRCRARPRDDRGRQRDRADTVYLGRRAREVGRQGLRLLRLRVVRAGRGRTT